MVWQLFATVQLELLFNRAVCQLKSDHKPQAINARGTNPRTQIDFKYNTKNIIIYLQFIVAANL